MIRKKPAILALTDTLKIPLTEWSFQIILNVKALFGGFSGIKCDNTAIKLSFTTFVDHYRFTISCLDHVLFPFFYPSSFWL